MADDDDDLDLEDDISSDEETAAQEEALAQRQQKLAAEKQRIAEEAAALAEKRKKTAYLRRWGPILFLTPMAPAVLALITITWGGLVLNVFSTECNYPLAECLSGAIGISYIFLFFLTWIYIGPKPFKLFRPVIKVYACIYFCSFCFYGFFTWALVMAVEGGCHKTAPALYSLSSCSVYGFWIASGILATYGSIMLYQSKTEGRRKKEQQRKAELAKRVKAEEEAKAAEAAKQKAAQEEEEKIAEEKRKEEARKEFYGASSSDEEADGND